MLIKEVKQGAKIDFEKTNITISKFKVSTNHWLSTLLSSLYAFSILKERQPSLVAYSKKRSMVDVSIKQSWGIVIHLNLFWKYPFCSKLK